VDVQKFQIWMTLVLIGIVPTSAPNGGSVRLAAGEGRLQKVA
jgi:hypothetical protein